MRKKCLKQTVRPDRVEGPFFFGREGEGRSLDTLGTNEKMIAYCPRLASPTAQ